MFHKNTIVPNQTQILQYQELTAWFSIKYEKVIFTPVDVEKKTTTPRRPNQKCQNLRSITKASTKISKIGCEVEQGRKKDTGCLGARIRSWLTAVGSTSVSVCLDPNCCALADWLLPLKGATNTPTEFRWPMLSLPFQT